MDLATTNLNTYAYIRSEAAFQQAKQRGFWETAWSRLWRRSTELAGFNQQSGPGLSGQTVSLGWQDVSLAQIVGSVSRAQDYTRNFAPRHNDSQSKERWRTIYTLAVTGKGFPPVTIYKIGAAYFVEDGHHRVSVARYLGWQTIQAQVIEI